MKHIPKQPVIIVGCLELRHIVYLCRTLDMSVNGATRLLKALKVPLIFVGKDRYFLVSSLEEGLMAALHHGGSGLVAPGSIFIHRHERPAETELPDIPAAYRERLLKRLEIIRDRQSGRARSSLLDALKNAKLPKSPGRRGRPPGISVPVISPQDPTDDSAPAAEPETGLEPAGR